MTTLEIILMAVMAITIGAFIGLCGLRYSAKTASGADAAAAAAEKNHCSGIE